MYMTSYIPLISEYVNKLIDTLPNTAKTIGKIDLVLEGGSI